MILAAPFLYLTSNQGAWAQSPTPTFSPAASPSPTSTKPPSHTPTFTPTSSPTATVGSPTFTPTSTFTFTATGTPPTSTPTPSQTPSISRASLALFPTAYSNAWDRTDGFDWDIGFTYYIGSLFSRDVAKKDIDGLEKSSIALLTSDVKYAWLTDDGDLPGFANGFMMSFLAQVGSGNSSTGATNQSFQVAGNVMGGVFGVLSKTIAKDTAVHFGYVHGLREAASSTGIGFFTMNYSELLPFLNTKLSPLQGQSPASLFYTGFNTRFLDRNWKFEILKPFPMDENPILFNTQIDGLPLAFNLGYERWDHGYAVLGYVNVQITLLPQAPAY